MTILKGIPKRIVIIGSAGTGKTTLFEALQKKIKLKPIKEQARVVCKELGYRNIYEIEDPNKFRLLVLERQIKLEEKLKQFISDRSCIDCWIHWVRWSYGIHKTFESEKYFKTAFLQSLKYSHIIYLPRLITSKEDGFRWNNEDYQNQIDRLFKATLLKWQLMNRTYIIRSSNLKERVKEVLDFS
ncbi:MAG: ATP-binding protein [Candidatus Melainabacteria bacterium]|nr:ATP-binding protein [Candidatus Melainabacteria bacterium]